MLASRPHPPPASPIPAETQPLPFLLAENFGGGNLGIAAEWWSFDSIAPTLTAYTGNGNGTISEKWAYGLTDYPSALAPAFADFNHDGRLDFVYTQEDQIFGGGAYLFAGKGNGSFADQQTTSPPVYGSATFAGDFNGDGIPDVAILNFLELPNSPDENPYQAPLGIVLGTGGGNFVPYADPSNQPSTTLVSPVWMVMGDFNRDGILDLAFADSVSTALTVLLGNGDGTFTQKIGQPDAGQTTQFIATADLNGDGKLDLVLVSSSNSVLIYLGNGDGTFQTPLEVGTGNSPAQVAIGDFNNDGRLDLAVVNTADNTVSLLLQAPSATVSPSTDTFGAIAIGDTSNPRSVRIKNTGSAALQIASIVATADFAVAGTTCGSVLSAGHSCFVSVVFKPTATGPLTGTLTITNNAADSPQVIALSGTGK